MNTGKLISYLDSLITLEKEIDSLENIIAGLENEINKTYPFNEKKPVQPKEPVAPSNPENAKKRLEQEKQTDFISITISFMITFGIISAIVCWGAIGIGYIIEKVAKTNDTVVVPISALCGGVFSFAIALWMVIRPEKMRKKEITEKQKRLDVNYAAALKKYENDKSLRQTNSRLNSINSNITYNNYLNEVIIEQNRYRNKLAEWQYYG